MMLDAIRLAQQAVAPSPGDRMEYVIAGETNLMGFAELSNMEKLRGCSRPLRSSETYCICWIKA